jgi:hypothetical protein
MSDSSARLDLAREANYEISKLAGAVSNICQTEDRPIYHGMMARIILLTEVIFHSMRMGEDGDDPDIETLQRAFKGLFH